MKKIILPLLVFASSAFAQNSVQINLNVEKYQLANGLTVILHEDHNVPMISYHTWYRVGSRNEKVGVTGAAHMLEHMMFKGAKKYSGKDFDRILHENGITNNAFTTNDYTGFFENLPSSKLELIMDMEVDRMASLALRPEDLTSEREVVKEERRWRTDNNPLGLLREYVMSMVFKVSNYRWPVIGYMSDIDAYTAEKLRFFYETYYVPNNAVLVIAGDFDTPKVKKMLEKYYGGLKAKALPDDKLPQEPAQQAARSVTIEKELQAATLILSYMTPKAGTDESYALDLAANILSTGNSSRLYKKFVYLDQKAEQVGAGNTSMKDESMFQIYMSLNPGVNPDKVLPALYNEMWKIRNVLVSDAELQKAKNQVMKDYVDGLMTIDGKARALAINEILFNDYRYLFKDLEKYNRVTAEDIKNVASKYLQQQQRDIAILIPEKK